MANRIYQRQKPYRLIEQLIALRKSYPESLCNISHDVLYWRGKICPDPLSQTYLVYMKYELKKRPNVTVQGQNLKNLDDPKFPHRFNIDMENQSVEICLYLGKDFTSQMLLADTIIPWTVEWLYYYEIWLAIGKWCGGGQHPNLGNKIHI